LNNDQAVASILKLPETLKLPIRVEPYRKCDWCELRKIRKLDPKTWNSGRGSVRWDNP